MNEKTCRQCHESKPIAEFYPCSNCADGHRTECKVCTLKNNAENKAAKKAAGVVFA